MQIKSIYSYNNGWKRCCTWLCKTYINQIIEICDEDIKLEQLQEDTILWIEIIDGIELKGYDAIAFANPLTSNNVLEYIDDSYKMRFWWVYQN